MNTPDGTLALRAAGVLARHAGRTIAVLGALMLAAYLTAILLFPKPDGRVIFGDATHHFVQLRSMVFDRDLDFQNEYVRLYHLTGSGPGTEWVYTELTPTGHVRNYMPVGPALLWAPLYLIVVAAHLALAHAGLGPPPDGFERSLQLVPGITGIAAAALGTWISWRLARQYCREAAAAAAAIAIWIGSHALYYSLVSPSYSHAASMLTSAFFFERWLRWRSELSTTRLGLLGLLAGAAALMRWQDALFIAVPLIEAARWSSPWRRRLAAACVVSVGFLLAFSPQMIVWTVLYGQPFAIPQGPSFLQWTSPHLLDVLVSDNHGLFSWAPLLLFSIWGLALFGRRHPGTILPLAVVLLSSWYVNAAVVDWWAGEAFGARRFLSLTPLFVLGLATWLDAVGRPAVVRARRLGITAGCIVLNGLLLLQYEFAVKGLTGIAPAPHGWFDMYLARFIVPFRLLAWWHR
jgi:hypothetical protein